MAQDLPLELLQRRRRLDPERVDERAPQRPVGLERLLLAACAVEDEHAQRVQALAQRVLGDQGVELGREAGACARAAGRRRCGPPAHRAAAPAGARPRGRRRARRRGRRAARHATGRARRAAAPRPAPRRRAPSAAVPSAVSRSKRSRSTSSGPTAQPVAGRQRLDGRGRAQRLAQLRDLAVDLRDGGDRRRVAVELAGEPVDRDDAVGVQQQHGQQRALPRPAEADGAVGAADRERAEDREAQGQTADRSARGARVADR